MEALWDPGTQGLIERLGIQPGWRCLEVGAGGGSMAEWMADAVGDGGHVLATDVSTRYLDAIERPNVEVREHNVLEDPLPDGEFDVVHARLVVEHIGTGALERLVPALRPGGWLLLEDYDFSSAVVHPEDETMTAANDAVLAFMSEHGFDPDLGRKLVSVLTEAGLEEVDAEGRTRVFRGGSPGTAFYRLSLESLRGALVEAGKLDDDQVERALAAVADPANVFLSPTMVAAWGRRPS